MFRAVGEDRWEKRPSFIMKTFMVATVVYVASPTTSTWLSVISPTSVDWKDAMRYQLGTAEHV